MNHISRGLKYGLGSLFMTLGIAAIAGSVYVGMNPLQKMPDSQIKNSAMKQCESAAKDFNYNIVKTANQSGFEFSKLNLDEWERDLSGFSLVIMQCNGFEVKNFCMGTSCFDSKKNPVTGTVLNLKYKHNK